MTSRGPTSRSSGGVVALAAVLALGASSLMDRASLADDEAAALGVPLHALRVALFISSGVLTAAAVILAGPIGFVGLICPHVVRLAAGPRHAGVILGSLCAGPALVIGADSLVKALDLASGRLPIGVITPLIGAPVLLTMLRRRPPAGVVSAQHPRADSERILSNEPIDWRGVCRAFLAVRAAARSDPRVRKPGRSIASGGGRGGRGVGLEKFR
jgi:hypothetical protein